MAKIKRTRFVNTTQVLREIWVHGRLSRIQIARNLDLDKSTISSIVSELLSLGVVQECEQGEASPRGGRKPVYLRLNPRYGCVLGIEIRPEGFKAVAVDLEGKVLQSWSGALASVSGRNLREVFLDTASQLRSALGSTARPLGIGVGLAGVVNPQRGVIRYSIPLQIAQPWDFRALVADRYDLPLFIENDANACAWGELVFHRSKKLRDFLFVLTEIRSPHSGQLYERVGVGMGIVIGGKVHHGHSFSAGEFRSVLCGPADKGQFALSDAEATRLIEDPSVLERFVRELARNIAMLVNTFNLDHVFLGGDIEHYRGQVAAILREEIQRNWPYPDEVQCGIGFSSHGDRAVAYGAAALVLQRLFADREVPGRIVRVSPVALLAAGSGVANATVPMGSYPPLSGEPPGSREKSREGGVS